MRKSSEERREREVSRDWKALNDTNLYLKYEQIHSLCDETRVQIVAGALKQHTTLLGPLDAQTNRSRRDDSRRTG